MKSAFNLNPSTEHRLKLKDIEHRFVAESHALREKRESRVLPKFEWFHSKLIEFTAKRSRLINDKRVINGYDEMKTAKQEMAEKVENELVHIESDEQFAGYFRDNVLGDGNTRWYAMMCHDVQLVTE